MHLIKKFRIEYLIIILCIIVTFLAKVDRIPSVLKDAFLLFSSFYFFPIRLIIKKSSKQKLISDILISFSLIIVLVKSYKEIELVSLIFTILNIALLMYFGFSSNTNVNYRYTLICHFFILLILAL